MRSESSIQCIADDFLPRMNAVSDRAMPIGNRIFQKAERSMFI
jgi:hypothetical protein